ncbi:glycoside hydrolase family 15 protein [Kitasatospora purpeofusca]|uniref:glycoside hydrolase family 15 protein n=1 Tax=Kitasatospora purpeofusca TaxID=67352 RepID=UPI00225107A8|nr:glycoside hydrolase family 15 protein [Kitasatospora purpeofusca]MCX4758677.1 glycoside hydrolase family 15 protein [Kitasatospora purpeofusca]WSR30889.1 glycoside hydrolase family 15 protein [Kitasatospora purpeofusca]
MLRAPAPFRIEDLALLGNTRSAALVRPDGAINFACLPDFDSPAVFAAMLGGDEHGFWRIGPAVYDGSPPPAADRRQYLGDTMVLRQEWDTDTGTLAITDFMPAPDVTDNAEPQIIRIVECVSGVVRIASVFRPRTDYGATLPVIQRYNHGASRLSATTYPHAYWLDGPSHTVNRDGVCRADLTLHAHQSIALSLTWKLSNRPAPIPPDAFAELDATVEYWEQWARGCTYRGPHRDAVVRSALTLKAMCHPGGGVIAAPTTSLPEQLGGVRQWDYRFVWLRDSALAIAALIRLGQLEEARRWRRWLVDTLTPERLQPIYRINGDTDLDEEVLDHLPGYENSRPVRIGNGAAGQLQLDVFGELADTLLLAEDAGLPPSPQVDALLLALLAQVELRWREPDEGIWEIRGEAQHFTHSKVMCWVAVDRTLRLLERRTTTDPAVLVRLSELREEIHHDVCTNGIDAQRGVFTQYYGGQDLDASLLLIPQAGFLPADDKRVIATIEAVQRDLTEHGLVLRYTTREASGANVDGLAGHEGAFLACSFWLTENLTAIGRTDEATGLFDRLLALRSDLGLLAEEYDPFAKRQLGNYPQAFSHWALVDAAVRLTPQPRSRRAAPPRPRASVEQAVPAAVVA